MIQLDDESVFFLQDHKDTSDGVWLDDISIDCVTEQVSAEAISGALDAIIKIGMQIQSLKRTKDFSAKELSIEFGIDVGASGKIVIVQGEVGAHLKIKAVWK